MNIEFKPTVLKTFSWSVSDEGNNDDYSCLNECVYTIDSGVSSSITEEELLDRFVEKSMKVLRWREDYNEEKLDWKLVKHSERNYSIEYWNVDYGESDSSTLTSLSIYVENTFQYV